MTDNLNHAVADDRERLEVAAETINRALQSYSDKDWNYSRICLTIKPLHNLDGAYVMRVEVLDLATKDGSNDRKTLADEVKWGERHSSELGILELVSLRINMALLEGTSDEYWQHKRPIIRIAKKEASAGEHATHTLWYEVIEVAGEDFDNR